MTLIKFEDLLDTGAHFGHVTRKWHPNYKPYVLMEKNGVHIINLDETISSFKKATDFIQSVVKKNGEILFIGTKKQAKDIVQQEADRMRDLVFWHLDLVQVRTLIILSFQILKFQIYIQHLMKIQTIIRVMECDLNHIMMEN